MTSSWSQAHLMIVTKTITYTSTIISGIPSPSPNGTYSTLCDGLPRFDSQDEAINATVLLPTPITTVMSGLDIDYIWPTGQNFPPAPSCSIKNAAECSAAWSLFGSSLASSNSAWSTNNVLTVSLASPPTSIVVNNKATALTAPPGSYPILTLHGEEYGAEKSTYTISGGTNLYGEVTITPGGRQVFTWDMDQIKRPFGPSMGNCTRPTGNIIQSQCTTAQCTIAANRVELLYFPAPSTTRDLCADTSPGYNSYSVSIYSQPHASTVINATTYWYDKAYVRYDTVSAYKWCKLDNQLGSTLVHVGGTYSKRVVEVASSDVSSICDWRFNPTMPYGLVIGATAKPFNFEDLVGDIPASAYQCLPQCQRGCRYIVSSYNVPALAVPPQVRAQDPEWANCVPQFDGVPDPPIALASAPNFLTSATMSGPRTSDPPNPGQTISTGASPTAIPITQPPFTTRFTSTISIPNDPGRPADPSSKDPNPGGNPLDPPSGRPSTDPALPNNSDPGTSTPLSPQQPSEGNQPVTGTPVGLTPIATIGGSTIATDPSQPGTLTVLDPSTPSSVQTLTAGSDPIVISGTTISVNPSSGAIVVSGDSTLQPVGFINGKPVFVDSEHPGTVFVGSPGSGQPMETLTANGPTVVIDGEVLTLSSSGAVSTSTTVAGVSIDVLTDSTVVVDHTHKLKPGDDEIFVKGHKIVVDPNGAIWVDDQLVGTATSRTILASMTDTSSTSGAADRTDSRASETGDSLSPTAQEPPQGSTDSSKGSKNSQLDFLLVFVLLTGAVI